MIECSFKQPLDQWKTGNVTYMSYIFGGATSFDQPLNNWDTSNVTNMNGMFNGATSFNQDLSGWDVSQVSNINTFNSSSEMAKTPGYMPGF